MRTRIQFLFVVRALILSVTMSGCLSATQVEAPQNSPIVVDPKTSMLKSLEGHARRTIGSINSVVIDGDFLKALKLENPPEPIQINEEELRKGMGYLLGTPEAMDVFGRRFLYTPDPRFCSEVAAKENPATCIETISHVRFEQIMVSDTQGTLQARFDDLRPFLVSYGPSSAEVTVSAGDMVAMFHQFDVIRQAHGEIQQPEGPSLAEGTLRARLVENSSSSETISVSVDQRFRLGGTNSDGGTYSIDLPAASNVLSLTFDTALSQGRLVAQVPGFELEIPVHADMGSLHEMQIHFPGLTGELVLDNATKSLTAHAVTLALQGLKIDVDGSPALEAQVSKPLSAHVTPDADGKLIPCFDADFAFTADIPGFAGVIEPQAPVNFTAAAGTCQSLD